MRKLIRQLFKINATPQSISLGLGLGVFLGIFPGTGPLAALFLAFVLRVNRAAILLGSLLTNTWLSIVTFIFSIKIGAWLMHLDWQQVRQDWLIFFKDFHWLALFKLSILKIILPVITGYIVVAFCLGLFVYLTSLGFLSIIKNGHKNKTAIPKQ